MQRVTLHTLFSRLRHRFEEASLDPLRWEGRIVKPGDQHDNDVVQRAQKHAVVLQLLTNFHYCMYEAFQEVDERAQDGHPTDFYVAALECADKAGNYGLLVDSAYLKDVSGFVRFPMSIWTRRQVSSIEEWTEEIHWLNGAIHRDRLQPLNGWEPILVHDRYQESIVELQTLVDYCYTARTKT